MLKRETPLSKFSDIFDRKAPKTNMLLIMGNSLKYLIVQGFIIKIKH
jgi:hypothetical protein